MLKQARSFANPLNYIQKRCIHPSVIGIDLGTTNSAVGIVQDNVPRILENEEGGRTTPSVVAFNNETLVGFPAKRQALINPRNTFFSTKRLIGRKFIDEEVQKDLANIPYKVVPNVNGDAWLETSNGDVSPSEISSIILDKMRHIAQSHLTDPIEHAVVTVPAYFNDAQRQATKSAGKMIGLNILRVVNEPTAAALAYGVKNEGIIAVFDLGGGTFDISILDIEDGVFEVRATNGNTHLGGEDFDNVLLNYIVDAIKQEHSNLNLLVSTLQRIREAAEKCKIELSHVKETEINLPFITPSTHFKIKLTEDQLDQMTLHLIEQTIDPVKKCIRDAELKVKDIDEVLLVGGMTRMPKLRSIVEDLFQRKPSTAVNPDEAVALGAAIQGAILSGQIKDVLLLDVTPLSLGIETYGGIFSPLIPRNSAVPVKKEQIFSSAVDNQTGVEIRVYQGERSLVKDNKLIGNFKLSNIPPGPKGSPQIAVTFNIDADGIINVSATDKTKYPDKHLNEIGNTVSIQVSQPELSRQEIELMIEESEAKKVHDEEMRKYYEHASRAEILCTDTDNAVEQFGLLMTEEERLDILSKNDALKKKIMEIRDGTKHDVEVLNEELLSMQKVCLEAIKKVAEAQRAQKNASQ